MGESEHTEDLGDDSESELEPEMEVQDEGLRLGKCTP